MDWGEEWDNVWLGVSVETQIYFNRTSLLAQIPGKTRFISAESLLDELDILAMIDGKRVIDSFKWVIVGGESGNETVKYIYRPCELEWIKRIINDAKYHAPHISLFNKKLCTYLTKKMGLSDWHGGDLNEWQDELKVREFPVYRFAFLEA
jgi:protein gp37